VSTGSEIKNLMIKKQGDFQVVEGRNGDAGYLRYNILGVSNLNKDK
jgi:hypothetical protein